MKLLVSPASPFVRKARVLVREANLVGRVEEVVVATTPMASDPNVIAANPAGKIPALIREDGPALYDSRVICQYLASLADRDFYQQSRRWDILTLEATADAIMDAAVSMTYETRFRPEAHQSSDWIEAQWSKADRCVAAINRQWISHLSGPVHIGQITVSCALSYLDLRHNNRGWRIGKEALAAWHDKFAARESMLETVAD